MYIISEILELMAGVKKDKLLHFFYGALIASLTGVLFGAWWGILATLSAGLLKEVFDLIDLGEVEALDLMFTVFGGLVVLLPMVIGG